MDLAVQGLSLASLMSIVYDGLQESLVTEPIIRLLEVLFYSTFRWCIPDHSPIEGVPQLLRESCFAFRACSCK
jgi:hypothetical protein